ncbi:nuclear transport factor 2 family protein [Pseudonocardia sp. KRD-184]|uniref:Nuclear transport factor 2 family protein n=1 Tax=Pseudonocardia oceani TaxID=2792013 RepID=A0ABS6UFC9_9PSEU|nr:nuclear transport factor 2 family protein [Pseudonocardia oceani]MBW0088354.1 nuclear transport factor 2 family protein [Pseudonocardia oceani]MBW0096585.1 nuclear transport factor 2 family protein [Pseudonocardia oceani]MBW0109245.1 nuclear transport factor 2 family protein [Pseudonocardia oceani]MBW0120320.1 nuclear transport factor 2 family protein [Pseudonocardia oceani]MBW0130937.1 nuclear transport factor 2 family protein [Pseudonocardia oceani]
MTHALPVEDRLAVADLLADYCELVDAYDIDAVALLFTADCVTDYGPGRGGRVAGRDAVRDRIAAGQAQFRRTHHQLGQSRLRPRDAGADAGPIGAVDALTYVTAMHEEWDGRQWRAHLRYVDVVVRTRGGWLLAERRVHAAVIDGRPEIEWVWVERRTP